MRTDFFRSQRLGCVPALHPSSRKPSWRFEQSTGKPSDCVNRCQFRKQSSSSSSVSFDGRDFNDHMGLGLGPDPVFVSKQIRLSDRNIYAGSAFSQSPSPRSLPLPTFAKKNFEDSATKNLRRMLGLD